MLHFLEDSFWTSPMLILTLSIMIFAIVFLRYALLAVLYNKAIVSAFRNRWIAANRKEKMIWRKEIQWSAVSSLVFAVLATGSVWLYTRGLTKVYVDIGDYSFAYFFLSVVILLVAYETYYYWLHRWMHLPGVFRIVHKVHHESIHTSVFTSFSFHPIEALLQFLFLPLMVIIMPIHLYALGIVLMLMTISAIVNHAGVEIFPKGFDKHPVGRWLIGATHHDLHHKEFRTNFGLYFTFWDKWMNTESDKYEEQFRKNAAGQKGP